MCKEKKNYVNIHDFDIAIHRTYFHVKPIEYELHIIWQGYLDV